MRAPMVHKVAMTERLLEVLTGLRLKATATVLLQQSLLVRRRFAGGAGTWAG